ncbi:MAG: hypothetical protein K0U37_00250 [Gammaproteobacteria bacterium]|nr:hypothetical protein [Gammaproteobacteria bacterium]
MFSGCTSADTVNREATGHTAPPTAPNPKTLTRSATTVSEHANGQRKLSSAEKRAADLSAREAYLGRNPNNKTGKELAYGPMAKRSALVCLFLSGGCLIKLGDDLYSWATGELSGVATGNAEEPGVDHLASSFLANVLVTKDEADSTASLSEDFLRTYFSNCNIFDTTGDELEANARKLRRQLFDDIASRRLRKVMGDRLVFWSQLALAAFVSIIAFTRGIVQDQDNTEDELTYIGYTEGAFALLTILLAQSINKATVIDEQATLVLERIRKFVLTHVAEKQTAERKALADGTASPHVRQSFLSHDSRPPVEALMPVEDALFDMRYQTTPIQNFNHSLLEAVAKLRTKLGYPSNIEKVQRQLTAYLGADASASTKPVATARTSAKTTAPTPTELTPNSLAAIEQLSLLYDCPIFVLCEEAFEDGLHCKLINETIPPDAETKDEEERPGIRQTKREANAMILYCAEEGYYRAIHTPKGIGGKRAFELIKQQLMTLEPKMPSADNDDEEKASSDYAL